MERNDHETRSPVHPRRPGSPRVKAPEPIEARSGPEIPESVSRGDGLEWGETTGDSASKPTRGGDAGFQILELVVALAVTAVVGLIAYPSLVSATSALRLDLAAQGLVSTLRQARATAIRRGTHAGIKLYPLGDGRVEWRLHVDGDGDGVRTADIDDGVDPPRGPRRRLAHFGRHVRFGFPSEYTPRNPSRPGRPLTRLDDPVRFNRSDMASFGPLGTGTPGSLYLTDGRRRLVAVRLFARTGKIRVIRYDPEQEVWR